MPAFRRFQRDFDEVAQAWIEAGEETAESVEAARNGLRVLLADKSDPDRHGVGRVERLNWLFAYWADLADQVRQRGRKGVVPVLSLEAERRIADRKWEEMQRKRGKRS